MRKHSSLRRYCDFFPTDPYNSKFDFVYITWALGTLEESSGGVFPFDQWFLSETDLIGMITPEILHLLDLYHNANSDLPHLKKKKHAASIRDYEKRYPSITSFLKENNFDLRQISPKAKWDQVMKRYPEDFTYAVKSRQEF